MGDSKDVQTKEYGMPLFHELDYNPSFTYKPFTLAKCTKTYEEHYQIVKYRIFIQCSNCQSRLRGERTDDICNCE